MANSPGKELHLILPSDLLPGSAELSGFVHDIDRLLKSVPVASVELTPPSAAEENALAEWQSRAKALRPVIQDLGVAVIVRLSGGNPKDALVYRDSGFDGVMVESPTAVRAVRALLGPTDIVGYCPRASSGAAPGVRHDAMVAGENGADVVTFSIDEIRSTDETAVADTTNAVDNDDPSDLETGWSVVHWWAEMMEIPCIAVAAPTIQSVMAARDAGADFLGLDGRLWDGRLWDGRLWKDTAGFDDVIDRLKTLHQIFNQKA